MWQENDRRAGVGVVLEARGRGPAAVAQLTPGGPAEASGRIRIGDILTAINGQSMAGRTPQEISNIIGGQENTELRLAFRRMVNLGYTETESMYEVILMRGFPAYDQSGMHAHASMETSAHHAQIAQHPVYPNALTLSPGGTRGRTRSPFLDGQERKSSVDLTASGFRMEPVKIAPSQGHEISPLHGLPNQHQDEYQFHKQRSDGSPAVNVISATEVNEQGQAIQGYNRQGQAGPGPEDRGTGAKMQLQGFSHETPPQDEQIAAQGPTQAEEDLRQQLKNLLEFLKSGYTSTGQYEDSLFMTSGSEDAELMKQVYAEAASLKSREASSENVLRVAKETLDARKRQIKSLTASLKKAHVQLMTLKRHEEDRGESHGSGTVSMAEVDLDGGIDPEDDNVVIDGSEEEGVAGAEEREGADEKTRSN